MLRAAYAAECAKCGRRYIYYPALGTKANCPKCGSRQRTILQDEPPKEEESENEDD